MVTKSENAIDRHVGARIRMQRIVRDISQTELGNAVGVSFQQVQKYEKGVNRVSASRLQRIANVLKVAPETQSGQDCETGMASGKTSHSGRSPC